MLILIALLTLAALAVLSEVQLCASERRLHRRRAQWAKARRAMTPRFTRSY